ncbi:hypothetical protein DFP73DRAFT_560038, partial [Morchella snyderi]
MQARYVIHVACLYGTVPACTCTCTYSILQYIHLPHAVTMYVDRVPTYTYMYYTYQIQSEGPSGPFSRAREAVRYI